ncbi:mycothiol system anti-sigma-R factor [Haematomicrobium sanguinis]|uniref:mycothiol system anti-sigma-R factor n=1 Tax=Haematomicrobium sanguinis TaxID=479106 RepID=UPI00047AFCFC|nr:mycothiol system anti-sigma-R factor [Haematomicrobium sanguinis]
MGDCQTLGDCEDDRLVKIYEYLDGALTREDLEAIKEHLDTCEDCAKEYDVECILRAAVKRCCTESAPSDLRAKILAKLHAPA